MEKRRGLLRHHASPLRFWQATFRILTKATPDPSRFSRLSVCNVVWREILLGHMANRQDNDLLATNRKHRAMRRSAS
jgi:hypothetical protein